MPQDDNLIRLSNLRKTLNSMMKPEILTAFTKFLEDTAWGDGSLIERYEWFCNNGEKGPDCRYAAMAKNFFLQEQADNVAETINFLYHNWSKFYEE
jgi:hypothetical protein